MVDWGGREDIGEDGGGGFVEEGGDVSGDDSDGLLSVDRSGWNETSEEK